MPVEVHVEEVDEVEAEVDGVGAEVVVALEIPLHVHHIIQAPHVLHVPQDRHQKFKEITSDKWVSISQD